MEGQRFDRNWQDNQTAGYSRNIEVHFEVPGSAGSHRIMLATAVQTEGLMHPYWGNTVTARTPLEAFFGAIGAFIERERIDGYRPL